jgi:hypothetical protein
VQTPPEQVFPPVQAFVQLPQYVLLVFVFTHWPPHPVRPLVQQTPFELTRPLAQQRPDEQLPLEHWMLFVQLPVPFGVQLPPLQ